MIKIRKLRLIQYCYRICLQCRRPQFDSWVRKICWRRDRLPTPVFLGFPCGSAGKESTCNVGDLGFIPGLGISPGEGKGCPLQNSAQNSGLENSMDCIVHGITKIGHNWVTFTFIWWKEFDFKGDQEKLTQNHLQIDVPVLYLGIILHTWNEIFNKKSSW